ncbi:SMP-30/gluconolactonase/LRE family protein [Colwellia echini]|uniref:SMP-30/gluconolactonase/LRE family protein n=1 Tax=Colwellia echini TaxID=1982103 RepID=A0ABY3MXI0_9GAMM|nr:SMP-30/gluconolactonase/LRE family protein [Colwellia echini]TYK65787.1 SMP-30/gluconolactonase/LRE family protein [Colwellia echini]
MNFKKLSTAVSPTVFSTVLSTTLCTSALTFSMATLADEAQQQCQAEYVPINSQQPLTLVKDNFMFLEGPTWSVQNNAFYFSEMNFNGSQAFGPKSTIYQLVLPNNISVYKQDSGTNGLLAIGEYLYTTNHATRSLSRLALSSKQSETLVDNYQGLKFNSPNDLVQADNGTIYFTDPDWQLSGRKQETLYTGLYSFSVDGVITLLDKSLKKPNGVALSPDQKTLYVGSLSHEIVKYQIDQQGNIGDKEAFVNITSPDGMKVDCAGNIYAASHVEGVIYVYSSKGELLDKISVGPKATNIVFGGEHLKTHLITTDHGLYTIDVNIPGLKTP